MRVLSRLFRRLFLELLRAAFERKALKFFNAMASLQDAKAFEQFLAPAASAEWVVYAKAPFGGPEQVLEYLGRYTHRVAIANSRLVDFSPRPSRCRHSVQGHRVRSPSSAEEAR